MNHFFTVIVTDDEGAEFYFLVDIPMHAETSRADEIKRALYDGRQRALEAGHRVAEARIDWQDTAETALTRVEELTGFLQDVSDCKRENQGGWEYYDADDVGHALHEAGL